MPEMTDMTQLQLEKFLKVYAEKGTVKAACARAGISRNTIYTYKREDPTFAARMKEAEEEYVESLEDEMHRRAVTGTLKPVWQGGKKMGSIRQHSDALLILMLKAKRPNVYRERAEIEHKGEGVISIQINAPAQVGDLPDPGDEA